MKAAILWHKNIFAFKPDDFWNIWLILWKANPTFASVSDVVSSLETDATFMNKSMTNIHDI